LHHMFAVGMSDMEMSFFSAGSMLVSIFTIVQIFAWVATIWRGRLVLTTSMLYALGSIVSLVIGGLSGVYTAVIPVDWQVHDTYFVVGHIHYVLIGANVFPVFAALYYWLPKMTGRMMNEKAGKWGFWIMFVAFNVAFFPMHLAGLAGMPRRIYTFVASTGLGPLNMLITVAAFFFGVGILIAILNFLVSMRTGELAGRNPWNADTLEWDTDSPPAPYGSIHIPVVVTRHPLWDDFDETEDPDGSRIMDNGRQTPATTWIDGEQFGISQMVSDSHAPLFTALTLFLFFIAMVFQLLWLALAGLILTIACSYYWLWPRSANAEMEEA
ncbi:MAG TPA: cbb3-type cytochrome c oxidase subunit I, partial [Candidatus Binataceae bacterium]|nr:cbb3-type cytochrome c oxidase subunit I [Candidatus Binataceae bacterium]